MAVKSSSSASADGKAMGVVPPTYENLNTLLQNNTAFFLKVLSLIGIPVFSYFETFPLIVLS